MGHRALGICAACILVAEAVFAVCHLAITGGTYGTFVRTQGVVIDLGLTFIWLGAALAFLVRRSLVLFLFAVAGSIVSFLHGALFSVAVGHWVGLPFIVVAVALGHILARVAPAWTGVRHRGGGSIAPPTRPRASHA